MKNFCMLLLLVVSGCVLEGVENSCLEDQDCPGGQFCVEGSCQQGGDLDGAIQDLGDSGDGSSFDQGREVSISPPDLVFLMDWPPLGDAGPGQGQELPRLDGISHQMDLPSADMELISGEDIPPPDAGEGSVEICDDGVDNDGDGYSDCEDLDCEGQPCPGGRICYSGRCSCNSGLPGYCLIPSGEFSMGSPTGEPGRLPNELRHEVTLTRSFYLKDTEVTQREYQNLMNTRPFNFLMCGLECPAETVSWEDALVYCNALSEEEFLSPCYTITPGSPSTFHGMDCEGYRLPTEAEWEYAARAGTTTSTYMGDIEASFQCDFDSLLDDSVWYCTNSGVGYSGCIDASAQGGPDCVGPSPVAGMAPNPWDLYDMLGNVMEWVWDGADAYTVGAVVDPRVDGGTKRIMRGGSYFAPPAGCRSAARLAWDYYSNLEDLGFRTARTAF